MDNVNDEPAYSFSMLSISIVNRESTRIKKVICPIDPSFQAGRCWMDALELALRCSGLLMRTMHKVGHWTLLLRYRSLMLMRSLKYYSSPYSVISRDLFSSSFHLISRLGSENLCLSSISISFYFSWRLQRISNNRLQRVKCSRRPYRSILRWDLHLLEILKERYGSCTRPIPEIPFQISR